MVDDVSQTAGRPFLVSFDIDGTLEIGHPPGPITLEWVRYVQQRGHRIGSSSDRTLGEQRAMWSSTGIEVDFVGHKHQLHDLRNKFDCQNFAHIGDTITDLQFAGAAGFDFWYAAEVPLQSPTDILLAMQDHTNGNNDRSRLSAR